MTRLTQRQTAVAAVTAALMLAACGGSSEPTSPSPPGNTSLAAPVPRSPANGAEITGVRPTLEVTNAVATGTVGTVTYRFEISEVADFPAGSRTVVMDSVAQGNGTTSVQVPVDLQPNFPYFWHARASSTSVTSTYSANQTVRTENKGFRNGQTIYDPLTNGQTVANQRFGGHFETGSNGGWQADSVNDSLDYDIPTCSSCRVEFDATNFDRSTSPVDVDLKWFSMGDGSVFNDFFAFRDSPWKMHVEKKSAEAGAVKLIWRRGCATSEDCDNTDNRHEAVAWSPSKVYHFTLEWGGGGMSINICEWNGTACVATVYQATGTGSYAPPNHRLELGTRPRSETLTGARFRNFKVSPR